MTSALRSSLISSLALLCACVLVSWTAGDDAPLQDTLGMVGNKESAQHIVVDARGELSEVNQDDLAQRGTPMKAVDMMREDSGEAPMPSVTGNLRLVYCASHSTKPYFLQLMEQLKESFPELEVEGEEYPLVAFIVNVLRIPQAIGVVWMAWGGEPLLRRMGFRVLPSFYYTIQKNGFYIVLLIYIVVPHLLSKVWQHGPLIVYLNDREVMNTFVSSTPPSFDELKTILLDHSQ